MIDRNAFREMDWYLVGLLLLNAGLGWVMISSSSQGLPGSIDMKQLLWLGIGSLGFFLILLVDYKMLVTYSPVLYAAGLVLLAVLIFLGRVVGGARSWFRLGILGIQPSEVMKILLILILARIYAEFKGFYVSWPRAAASVGATVLPLALVAMQPDLGTASTYVPLVLASLFLAGLSRKTTVLLIVAALGFGLLGWNFGLQDYQKKRILTLVSPSLDPRGAGYQIAQSKIAIGSGGILGKGLKKGTQSQLRFLPARHTDFVFSVLGEELGFAGVCAAFALFVALLLRLFRTVGQARDRAGIYIVFLAAVLLTYQFVVNILMVIGLFPVTGIPLPFYSYGGSSLLTSFLTVGLAVNVKMRRFVNV